jgi:hypothetical protein
MSKVSSSGRFYSLSTLGDANDDDVVVFDNFVDGIDEESYRINLAEELTSVYPEDARVYLDKKDKARRLHSLVGNTNCMIVVKPELKALIEKHMKGENVEYFPLSIYDGRKRVIGPDYFLVNPLVVVDCVDVTKSDVLRDEDDPDEILEVNEMVLNAKAAAKAPQLFRPEHSRATYIVRETLHAAMEASGATNLVFDEIQVG